MARLVESWTSWSPTSVTSPPARCRLGRGTSTSIWPSAGWGSAATGPSPSSSPPGPPGCPPASWPTRPTPSLRSWPQMAAGAGWISAASPPGWIWSRGRAGACTSPRRILSRSRRLTSARTATAWPLGTCPRRARRMIRQTAGPPSPGRRSLSAAPAVGLAVKVLGATAPAARAGRPSLRRARGLERSPPSHQAPPISPRRRAIRRGASRAPARGRCRSLSGSAPTALGALSGSASRRGRPQAPSTEESRCPSPSAAPSPPSRAILGLG